MSIRPFRLPGDLDTMNDLVMGGFDYPENPEWSILPDEKEGMLDQVRGAKRMWPLIRVLQSVSPSMKDVMCGFIAEENSQPVGLINFMRPRNEPEWYVANVTVLPSQRRKGLARQLVQATLDELRKRAARLALLDVVDGNLPAIQLYQTFGFESFSGSVVMDRAAGEAIAVPALPSGWTLTPLSRFDWKTQFELARRITPENVTRYEPPTEARFRMPAIRPLVGSLLENLGGNGTMRFALRPPEGILAGIASYTYRKRPGGMNFASLQLDPAHPEVAEAFVAQGISAIQSVSPNHRIEFEFQNWQPALIQAAEAFGCKKRFGALHMGLKFS